MIYGHRPCGYTHDPQTLVLVAAQGIRPLVPRKDVMVAAMLHWAWAADPKFRPTASIFEEQLRHLELKQGSSMWRNTVDQTGIITAEPALCLCTRIARSSEWSTPVSL
eukprot:2392712-Rhodomonas_salina.1